MNRLTKVFMFVGLFGATLGSEVSASPGTTTGTAAAEIVAPLAVTEKQPLNFGSFTVGAQGGSVRASDASTSGDVTMLAAGGKAAFGVAGEDGLVFQIVVDESVTLNGPGTALTGALAAPAQGTVGANGTAEFNVDGKLKVAGGQTPGVYKGTYNVMVHY